MKTFFITGTDTSVGKTTVAAALTYALHASYWKPIQSGLQDDISDKDSVQALTGLSDNYFCPTTYELQASLSPDQAAEIENVVIDTEHCVMPEVQTGHLIIEGAGGVLVPLNENEMIIDLIQRLQSPVVIVSRGGLGTVNHTLLTIAVLRAKAIPILGVVFSGKLNPANQLAIEKWGQVKTLFHLPYFENLTPARLQAWVKKEQKHLIKEFL